MYMGTYTQNIGVLPKSPGSSSRSSSSTEDHRLTRLKDKSGGHQDQLHAQNKDNWLKCGASSTQAVGLSLIWAIHLTVGLDYSCGSLPIRIFWDSVSNFIDKADCSGYCLNILNGGDFTTGAMPLVQSKARLIAQELFIPTKSSKGSRRPAWVSKELLKKHRRGERRDSSHRRNEIHCLTV